MLYSKSAEYAIQAMLYLAENEDKGLVMVSSVAEAYNIPRHFLAKLVQILTRSHLIKSYRGRNGGIKLARHAGEITILQIVNAIEGPPPEEERCVIGLDICSDDVVCPLHNQWQHIRDLVRDTLSSQTLEELAEGMHQKRQELAKLPKERELQETPASS
ncbi:MAG: Rrf2 family transcriptional regulator [Fidelibacterota bacterium]|nr:MAG: Rrf2 family transcriptional regulator [Candidatus Neomarinimicrobiota bacterium]